MKINFIIGALMSPFHILKLFLTFFPIRDALLILKHCVYKTILLALVLNLHLVFSSSVSTKTNEILQHFTEPLYSNHILQLCVPHEDGLYLVVSLC